MSDQDAALVNDRFSSHTEPTVWNVLPIFEQLIEAWQKKAADPRFLKIKNSILAWCEKSDRLLQSHRSLAGIHHQPV